MHIFLRNGLYVIAQCRQFMQWLELVGQFSLLSSIIAVDLGRDYPVVYFQYGHLLNEGRQTSAEEAVSSVYE